MTRKAIGVIVIAIKAVVRNEADGRSVLSCPIPVGYTKFQVNMKSE
jgi:hypothetical protein